MKSLFTGIYPVAVEATDDFKLLIVFDNNEKRVFDVKPYFSDPFFTPLSNPDVFKTVKLNQLTVEWLGDIDICPDELYRYSVKTE